jgi:Zn-dependent M28 family amino/carboxypeptidase
VTRGVCFISVKARNAQAAGARAVLTYNLQPGPLNATLGDPQASRIPVAAITRSAGTQLARTAGAVVELELTTSRRPSRSQNVLADTRPGAPRVLLAGAHLDSVIAGPGINDNGTGVAVLLEIARVLRAFAPQVNVRFGFWSAEELGLIGSRAYAQTLRPGSVAGYLNFDMLGSPTRAYGVYAAGPYTERWLEYFERRGLPAQRVDLAGRSDHFAFEQAGIPTGGLIAGEYACYHSACDRLGAVDTSALRDLARAAAYGIAAFAPRS